MPEAAHRCPGGSKQNYATPSLMVAVRGSMADNKGPFPSPSFCSISSSQPLLAEIPFVSQNQDRKLDAEQRVPSWGAMGRAEMSPDESTRKLGSKESVMTSARTLA